MVKVFPTSSQKRFAGREHRPQKQPEQILIDMIFTHRVKKIVKSVQAVFEDGVHDRRTSFVMM